MTHFFENWMNKPWKSILLMAVKISTGCVLSILIAYELGLNYCATAGVITILSIQNTKMETIRNAGRRVLSFLITLVLAKVMFEIFGYTTLTFGYILFVSVFLCISLGWEIVMSVNAVIASHFLEVGSMTWPIIFNETMIFIIGVGMGVLMNLHLRKDNETLLNRFQMMDEEMRGILEHMAVLILNKEEDQGINEYFHHLEEQIIKAEEIAWDNHHNSVSERIQHIGSVIRRKELPLMSTHWDIRYVDMRKDQCEILYEMYKKIYQIEVTPVEAEHISVFLKKMAEEYHEANDVEALLKELEDLFREMRGSNLPKERTEFESRAILFVFMLNMKEFLDIKNKFYSEKITA